MNTTVRSALPAGDGRRLDSIHDLFTGSMRERELPKRYDVLRPDDAHQSAYMLLTGYASRYRLMSDGRRLITTILVPGDVCDFGFLTNSRVRRPVATLTPCRIGEISCNPLPDSASWPGLAAALLRRMQRDDVIADERMLTLGRRNAVEALAHLFCELRERLSAVKLATADSFALTIAQDDMGDTLGVTSVHINRSLKVLRETGLITLEHGTLTIHDRAALERLAHFDPAYLRDEQD
ncbi:Crp/Fnr family transcriptional regulator [Methylorubrum sp. SB2]|uniref:Crp/Fnr family transcriptional regulator n=1 Tax=Methylorubrum subtropicum TaxID=3138812 RepID=UPI00313B8537